MATTTTAEANGKATAAKVGWAVPCPKCGDNEGSVSVYLDDLEQCFCHACDEQFSLDDVRAIIAAWQPVLNWLATAEGFRAGRRS